VNFEYLLQTAFFESRFFQQVQLIEEKKLKRFHQLHALDVARAFTKIPQQTVRYLMN
jgi:hypothetical protein